MIFRKDQGPIEYRGGIIVVTEFVWVWCKLLVSSLMKSALLELCSLQRCKRGLKGVDFMMMEI